MGYDKELDKEIDKKVLNFDRTQIIVSIHSYNDGPRKIALGRLNKDQESDEWRFSKLGRLTKEEALTTAGAIADFSAKMG